MAATLVCAGVPRGVSVVLDHQAFDVGRSLQGRGEGETWTGMRDLGAGPHFCATAIAGTSGASCFPVGFFFYVEDGREDHQVRDQALELPIQQH